jgi:hypothetical protein
MLPCEIKVFGSHAQDFWATVLRPRLDRGLHGTVIKPAGANNGRPCDMMIKRNNMVLEESRRIRAKPDRN